MTSKSPYLFQSFRIEKYEVKLVCIRNTWEWTWDATNIHNNPKDLPSQRKEWIAAYMYIIEDA